MILLNIFLLFLTLDETRHHVRASPRLENQTVITINKCCERFEILVDLHCTKAKDLNQSKLMIIYIHMISIETVIELFSGLVTNIYRI